MVFFWTWPSLALKNTPIADAIYVVYTPRFSQTKVQIDNILPNDGLGFGYESSGNRRRRFLRFAPF